MMGMQSTSAGLGQEALAGDFGDDEQLINQDPSYSCSYFLRYISLVLQGRDLLWDRQHMYPLT